MNTPEIGTARHEEVSFIIPLGGQVDSRGRQKGPQSKQRSRSTKSGRHYTPKATTDWEATVDAWARMAIDAAPEYTWLKGDLGRAWNRNRRAHGPLQVDILFVKPRPKALMGAKHPDGLMPCPKRPDRDNLVKAINDGLKGVWGDDAQVVCGEPIKAYAEKGGESRVEIRISPVDQTGFEAAVAARGFPLEVRV